MVEVKETASVPVDAAAAWQLVGDPAALASWHPAVESSEVEDDLRHVVLTDGAQIEERITESSDSSYSYVFLASPLPVRDCSSRVAVEPADRGATISWSGAFEPDGVSEAEAEELIRGIYRAGLDAAAVQLS